MGGSEFFKNVSNLNWEQGTAREGLNFSKMSRLKSTCTLIRSWEKFEAEGGQPHVHTPPLPLYGRCLKGPVHTSKWCLNGAESFSHWPEGIPYLISDTVPNFPVFKSWRLPFQISLKFKNVSNWSERGGQHFSNKSQIQKSLKYPIGGGGQAYFGHCSKFSCFLIMTPPLRHTFFFAKLS